MKRVVKAMNRMDQRKHEKFANQFNYALNWVVRLPAAAQILCHRAFYLHCNDGIWGVLTRVIFLNLFNLFDKGH